jgi:chitobiase/beta-hexosaminidase-like protein/Fn3 domain-containing protein
MSGATALAPCPTPTFTPMAGAIASGSNVVISAAALPAGTSIYFTTDGSTPTASATEVYNAGTVGIQVTMGETIQAISSSMGTACTDSPVASAIYTITAAPVPDGGTDGGPGGAPATPTFTPGGTATTQNNDFQVSLSSTNGSTLCYTMGTTAPTCTSTATAATCDNGSSTYTAPIAISSTATATSTTPGQVEVQAIACAPGAANSAVAQQIYTLQAAAPTMTPAPGAQAWSATLMGAFASTTTGATIDYTSNGTMPSCGTAVAGQLTYAAPFPLQSATYNAIACKTGYASGAAGPFTFTVTLTPPTITPAAGTLNVAPTFTVSNAANPTASWVCYSTSATAPACGTTTGACTAGTLLPAAGTFTGATDGGNVQAIACAVAGLTDSTVNSQGPYKLQLAAPVILPDAATAAVASYTLPVADGAHLAHLNISQASVATAADQAGSYMCWLEDPGVGIVPACGTGATPCLNGSTQATGAGPTEIEGAGATMGVFGGGDSVAVITCPGTTAATGLGFEGSAVSTTVFVGQGQAMPPTISATDNSATQPVSDTGNNPAWFSKVNAVLTNPNAASMTVCYTTDGTNPVCAPGSVAAGCATVDGTSSQNLTFKITAGGTGYVNPPTVVITPNNATSGCTGNPVATLTAGVVTGIAATGCSGYATPPSVSILTGAGAAAGGTATETVTFTVSNGGAGYTSAPVVTLNSADTVAGTCVATAHLTAQAVTSVTATGCTFDADPTVAFDNTGTNGAGAVATAHVVQSVTFTAGQITGGTNYTAAPAVTALVPSNGKGGTCTALAATQTNGVVTTVTATGCSGFSDFGAGDIAATFASQGPANGSANAAAAIAIPGNSISLAAIENNPTTVKTSACNAGLGTSPIVSATYKTQLQDPTIVATDTLTGAVLTGAAPITITAGDTLTIATTSNFTDTKLVYTTDGSAPTCAVAGTATAFTGASTTLTIPAPTVATLTVKVIACGANQQASAVQPATFNIDVANPVITSAVGTVALGSPGTDATGTTTLTAQNTVTATIKSPTATAGTYLCYSTNGSALTCAAAGAAAGCPGNGTTLINALTGTVPITTTGTSLTAIACTNGNASAVTGPVVYALDATPAVLVGTATAACPSVATIGFDFAATSNTGVGGPTTGAILCYSPAPFLPNAACAAAGSYATGGVSCSPVLTAAAPTTTVNVNQTGTIYTLACKANFTSNTTGQFPVTVAPYVPPVITVDGVINTTEWSAALGDQFPTAAGVGTSGGFTFGKTTAAGDTLFFSQSGFTAAAGMSVYLYLTDTTTQTAGTTSPQRVAGGGNLPNAFQAQYAINIPITAACGGANPACAGITTYTNAGAAWTATAMPFAVTVVVTAHALEASVLIADLPGAEAAGQAFDVAGEVYKSTAPAALSEGWSKTSGGAETFLDTYSAALCSAPLGNLNPIP